MEAGRRDEWLDEDDRAVEEGPFDCVEVSPGPPWLPPLCPSSPLTPAFFLGSSSLSSTCITSRRWWRDSTNPLQPDTEDEVEEEEEVDDDALEAAEATATT